jgi:hypothetical protein
MKTVAISAPFRQAHTGMLLIIDVGLPITKYNILLLGSTHPVEDWNPDNGIKNQEWRIA